MDCFDRRPPRVEVVTLGCKVNQADSREIMNGLEHYGYEVAAHWEQPDIIIVNTCAVTTVSEAKGRKEISRSIRRGARGLVITGCMADVSGRETSAITGVDLLVTREDKPRLPELLKRAFPQLPTFESDPGKSQQPGCGYLKGRARVFIKVQDGCDRRCSYCIVPLARGKAVSMSLPDILDKVKVAVEWGAREIVLCGINLGGWRGRKGEGLSVLVEEVLATGEAFRVRLSSLDPEDVNGDLLDRLCRSCRLCPHFHLPMQSGSDGVLARMGRAYRAADYLDRVRKIRSCWADPAVTTDVMVGFPDETEDDFAATLEILEEIKPSRLHVFRYSRRPGTVAAEMRGQVPEGVKRSRSDTLARLGEALAHEYASRQQGKVLEVLVEKMDEDPDCPKAAGTTENYLKAEMSGGGIVAGGLYEGKVVGTVGTGVTMTR